MELVAVTEVRSYRLELTTDEIKGLVKYFYYNSGSLAHWPIAATLYSILDGYQSIGGSK